MTHPNGSVGLLSVDTVPNPASTQTRAQADVSPAVIAFNNISKTFANGTVALDALDLAVRPGEFVSVVGPSGCGKSTLLRIASGLSPITSGRVETRARSMGYVFQDATLLPWRTIVGNVELLAELEGMKKAKRRGLARAAIDMVGLTGFEDSYPRELSGGMRMRASLARSLTLSPDAMLFDEPFGALDAITRERLNDEVLRLYTQNRFTAVFVTHAISEAVYLSTRVVVMAARPGRVVAEFDVPFDYPRTPDIRFDAAFVELSHQVADALREVSTV